MSHQIWCVPGQWIMLHGSCSSTSPPQEAPASVWLQLLKRRLSPTASTWWKHVLLHSDHSVHSLHDSPSGPEGSQSVSVLILVLNPNSVLRSHPLSRACSSGGLQRSHRHTARPSTLPWGSEEICGNTWSSLVIFRVIFESLLGHWLGINKSVHL